MSELKIKDITQIAIIAALYVALTIAPGLSAFAYGSIQFRVSEILMLLPFYNPKYSWSLILGCFISNVFSGSLGIYDMLFGTLATAIACYLITKVPNRDNMLWIVPIICAVINGLIVGAELYFILRLPFWINVGSVAVGEFLVVAIGAIVFYFLMKNQNFSRLFN
ncbi:QueT transporter family protein [Companilactobacillus baiquanensis]|uniref:QueT transporter family protein n=1 Tax=Companilactobacillus baiquanensis TaxID=2486005 RepID=A0ABW1UWM4_9LACO|nr:QueT transporter family protein [Companilactobacillus baiquanensis]